MFVLPQSHLQEDPLATGYCVTYNQSVYCVFCQNVQFASAKYYNPDTQPVRNIFENTVRGPCLRLNPLLA